MKYRRHEITDVRLSWFSERQDVRDVSETNLFCFSFFISRWKGYTVRSQISQKCIPYFNEIALSGNMWDKDGPYPREKVR